MKVYAICNFFNVKQRMSNSSSNRERFELRRFGPPSYKYTDLPRDHQPKQQTAPHTISISAHHTAPNMHEAQEGNPPPPSLPPPQQRATDNLAPEYFKGLSSENAGDDLHRELAILSANERRTNQGRYPSLFQGWCGTLVPSTSR